MGNKSSKDDKSTSSNEVKAPKVEATVSNIADDIRDALPTAQGRLKSGRKVTNQKLSMAAKTGILSLQEHGLKETPLAVFQLEKLSTLDLSMNAIRVLPSEVSTLLKLKSLKLDSNKLEALPDLSALPALKTLSVSHNRLAGPASLAGLPVSLTKLNLANNRLTEFPRALADAQTRLPALITLKLSANAIQTLPALPGLPALEELDLDDNRITNVNGSITQLSSLKSLSLQRNSIEGVAFGVQSLSTDLFRSSPVVVLELAGNPLTKAQLLDMEGVDNFLERRKALKDKGLHGGAALELSVCGLD